MMLPPVVVPVVAAPVVAVPVVAAPVVAAPSWPCLSWSPPSWPRPSWPRRSSPLPSYSPRRPGARLCQYGCPRRASRPVLVLGLLFAGLALALGLVLLAGLQRLRELLRLRFLLLGRSRNHTRLRSPRDRPGAAVLHQSKRHRHTHHQHHSDRPRAALILIPLHTLAMAPFPSNVLLTALASRTGRTRARPVRSSIYGFRSRFAYWTDRARPVRSSIYGFRYSCPAPEGLRRRRRRTECDRALRPEPVSENCHRSSAWAFPPPSKELPPA